MSNILLTTIVRNEARYLDRWHSQIKDIVGHFRSEHSFGLSVFENDSEDGSALKLGTFDWGDLPRSITTARLGSPYFVGGKHPFRTQLLADARNRAIFGFPMLASMDWVLSIEPDIQFTMEVVDRLINHERHYGRRFDIFTGKSVHPGTVRLYDSWGTRKTAGQTDWAEADSTENGLEPLWSTFNCLALYRADAIRQGHTFGGVNPRTSQPDCDTAVICERFRQTGFNEIYWDTRLPVAHDCQ